MAGASPTATTPPWNDAPTPVTSRSFQGTSGVGAREAPAEVDDEPRSTTASARGGGRRPPPLRQEEEEFAMLDQRETEGQILIKNPYRYKVRCGVFSRKVAPGSGREVVKVADFTLPPRQRAAFTPKAGSSYRFKFQGVMVADPATGKPSKKTNFVPVNLPHGADFNLAYSVDAMEVKRALRRQAQERRTGIEQGDIDPDDEGGTVEAINRKKKWWLAAAAGTTDATERALLASLVERSRTCTRRTRADRAFPALLEGIDPYGTRVFAASPEADAYDRKLLEQEQKQLVKELSAREKQLEAWRMELSKYRELMFQKKHESSEQMAQYRERHAVIVEAVQNYIAKYRTKAKRQNSKLVFEFKERVKDSIERARDQKIEMVNRLQFEVTQSENKLPTFGKQVESAKLKLTKFFLEGLGLVVDPVLSCLKRYRRGR